MPICLPKISRADVHRHVRCRFAKLYDCKTPVTAADLLNDRVLAFFEEHDMVLSRVLTDRGTEFCGTDGHEYELYLAVEDIDHTRTKAKSPQTNGICERFHKTVLNEFYRVTFRRSTQRSMNSTPIWMHGLNSTTNNGPIREGGAVGKLRCRHSSIVLRWPRKK